jgi:ATP synthase protein I
VTETKGDDDGSQAHNKLEQEVFAQEARKLRARRERDRSVWFGLGMFGLVGWSVAVPAMIGTALGLWIDARWPGRASWTLMGLFLGVALGCANAWRWISNEMREVNDD